MEINYVNNLFHLSCNCNARLLILEHDILAEPSLDPDFPVSHFLSYLGTLSSFGPHSTVKHIKAKPS